MCINVLLAKQSKIKEWMGEWEEYGCGISFGKDDWWKQLVRYLINDDLIIETQAQGMFFSTTDLTLKGKNLRTKLLTKYPKYIDLVKDSVSNSELYLTNFKIEYPEIQIIKSIKSINKSIKITKSTKAISKDDIESKNKYITRSTKSTKLTKQNDNCPINIDNSLRTKFSHILNSNSDSD